MNEEPFLPHYQQLEIAIMAKATTPKPSTSAKATATDPFAVGQMGNPAEVLEQFRTLAEDGMSKSKDAFEQAKAAFDEMQKDAEAGLHTAQEHSAKISLAAIDTMRANTESTLSHLEKMVSVKSVAELIELQTAFVREQAEKTVDAAKNMQGLYQKAGEDMSAPAKAAAEKAMGALKGE